MAKDSRLGVELLSERIIPKGRGLRVFADLHLHEERPQEISDFVNTCNSLQGGNEDLLILGDLLDAWLGPGTWDMPGVRPLADALRRLSASGVAVFLIRGNRDVLLEEPDGAKVGAQVADVFNWQSTDGQRIAFTHGDLYCVNDRAYQRLRWFLRLQGVRRLLRSLPLPWRSWLAARLRGKSRAAVARKALDRLALSTEAAAADATLRQVGQIWIGHLHLAEVRSLGEGRVLRILPAWEPGDPGVSLSGLLS